MNVWALIGSGFDPWALTVMIPVVCIASFIFTTVGFGGGVVAVPLAFLFLDPLFALPVLALIESFTVFQLIRKNHRHIARDDVIRIIPASAVGTAVGVWLLVSLPVEWLMIGMSVFISFFLLTRWLMRRRTNQPVALLWAWPTGVAAGICSGAFGAGGPPSAIYFNLRQMTLNQLRSSIATTGSANLVFRLTGFAVAGLYANPAVVVTAICLMPVAGIVMRLANKARDAMDDQTILNMTYGILAFSAISLALRSQAI